MTTHLYPCGYDGSDVDTRIDEFLDLDALLDRKLSRGHPEFVLRIRALLLAAGGLVGIGTAWRSSATQRAVFLARHYVVTSGGCCTLDGKRYALRAGYAHAAPPGLSWHEEHEWYGGLVGCQAVDFVGHDSAGPNSHATAWRWVRDHGGTFGIMTAWNWTDPEAWHGQMIEIPRSVTAWRSAGRPNPTHWALPTTPEEDMARIAKIRFKGYADQFALIPLGPDTNRRLDLEAQPPVLLDSGAAAVEREAGYPFTPTANGQ